MGRVRHQPVHVVVYEQSLKRCALKPLLSLKLPLACDAPHVAHGVLFFTTVVVIPTDSMARVMLSTMSALMLSS